MYWPSGCLGWDIAFIIIWRNMASFDSFALCLLEAHLKNARLSPTYLFTGADEKSRQELAHAFSCALQCPEKKYFQECGCSSCHKIERRNHPDVIWLGRDEDARSIKIEEVREALSVAALKPFEGAWKVFILQEAGRLTPDASNILLKTLEEPPEHTLFILLTENKTDLLSTLRSRTLEIRLRPVSKEALVESQIGIRAVEALVEKGWLEFSEVYAVKPREELQKILGGLLYYFLYLIREKESRSEERRIPSATSWAPYVAFLDAVRETQEALDDNANQKLALTRLATKLLA